MRSVVANYVLQWLKQFVHLVFHSSNLFDGFVKLQLTR